MPVDAQHPGDLARNLLVELGQRRRKLVEFGAAFRQQRRLAGVEEHFRREHEAVADDADVRTVAEDGAQAAEEFGAVARQFLHALRQRHVEPRAEVGDAALRFLVALLGRIERLFERRELAAQRGDLLDQHLDLRQRARGDLLLGIQCLVQFIGAALRVAAGAGQPVIEALDAVALALRGGKAGAQLRHLVVEIELCQLLQRQEIVERAILALSCSSALSLPVTSCDRKNCTTRNTESRNTIDSTSVDSASTKPGQ